MKNIKEKIESRRKKIDEASGFGETPKKRTYDDDFNSAVSLSEMQAKVEELDKAYKKARSEDEKRKIVRQKNKLQAKIQIMKEDS